MTIMNGKAAFVCGWSALDAVRQFMLYFPTGGLVIAAGVALLIAYRCYPEKFPPRLTARAIRWRAILLIVGGVALSVWDAFRGAH